MDAPKGRYSIVEKGGRLIVIDNATGVPASPVSRTIAPEMVRPRTSSAPTAPVALSAPKASRAPAVPRRRAESSTPSPRRREPASTDQGRVPGLFARTMIRLVSSGRDAEGRALIRWKWENKGKTARWDAALDGDQERRLARSLIAIASGAGFFLLMFRGVGDIPGMFAIPAWLGLTGYGILGIARLQKETGGAANV